MFVPCKATVKQGGAYIKVVPVVGLPSSAPGVIALAFNKVACGIADGGEAAETVMHIFICLPQNTYTHLIVGLAVDAGSAGVHFWLLVCLGQM